MSRLAPGRKPDMAMLLERRDSLTPYSEPWITIQLKIEDLVEEGKCRTIYGLRERLIGASRASDVDEQMKIAKQIDEHNKRHHPYRYHRGWLNRK